MVYIILSIVLLIIAKFIYDSFLTNNTEKNWEKYKKENPHKAVAVENSKGLNLNPNAEIRRDGYYLAKYQAPNSRGQFDSIYFFLIFIKNGFVGFEEIEDIAEWRKNNTNEAFKNTIQEINKVNEIECSPTLTKYHIKNGGINMKFFDPDDYSNDDTENLLEYDEWYGSIIHNGLILSFDKSYFNNALGDYVKENQIKNLKFEFVQINFK